MLYDCDDLLEDCDCCEDCDLVIEDAEEAEKANKSKMQSQFKAAITKSFKLECDSPKK